MAKPLTPGRPGGAGRKGETAHGEPAARDGHKEGLKEGLEEILKKCCSLMARRGFHGASMRDLANATGRSLGGLYHYFASKEELLHLVNLYGFTAIKSTLDRTLEGLRLPDERLYAMILTHTSYFMTHRDEMRVMLTGTHDLPAEKGRQIAELKQSYNQLARELVQDYCRQRLGRPLDDQELTLRTYLLFGMMNWMFSWYSPKHHGSVTHITDEIYRLFLAGLGGTVTLPDTAAIMKLLSANKFARLWDPAAAGPAPGPTVNPA